MKTLIENATKESKYLWEDAAEITLTASGVVAPDVFVADLNSSNSTLVENIIPPKDWEGCKYLYENGVFTKAVQFVDPLAYQAQRAAEYPPMTDYLDGIVKGDQAQVQAYIDACLAVKSKYPKPEL